MELEGQDAWMKGEAYSDIEGDKKQKPRTKNSQHQTVISLPTIQLNSLETGVFLCLRCSINLHVLLKI